MRRGSMVIGCDARPGGEDALALGDVLADVVGSTRVVARVLPWPRDLMGPRDLERALQVETGEDFAMIQDRLGPGVEFRAVADKSPARALDGIAREDRATMIVVGSAHRGRLGRTLLGSVGSSLVHGAPCAVAVAPKGFAAPSPRRLERIAVAFDGSPESWAALETAVGLAERVHGAVTVITVAEAPRYGYSEALGVLSAEGLRCVERAESERILDLALGRVPDHLRTEPRLLSGNPGRLMAEATADFDLIVCGSRGHGPILHTMLGSTSRALLAHAACPVLVLPRGAGVDPLGLGGPRAPAMATA